MKITTYKELDEYIRAFREGHLKNVVIVGRGGIGKSEAAQAALPEAILFKGRTSAVALHNKCSENPTAKILLDDVPSMFTDSSTVAELLQLCETKEDKTVTYHTATPYVTTPSFKSNNSVMILANSLTHPNPQVKALLTRGFKLVFEPDNEEVFKQLSTWAEDKEILAYIKSISKYVELNFRMYVMSLALKDARMDWKMYLRKEFMIDPEEDLARELVVLEPAERNFAWVERTGKSPRTLLRILSRLKAEKRL